MYFWWFDKKIAHLCALQKQKKLTCIDFTSLFDVWSTRQFTRINRHCDLLSKFMSRPVAADWLTRRRALLVLLSASRSLFCFVKASTALLQCYWLRPKRGRCPVEDNDGHFGRQRDICPGHMAQVSSRLLITLGRTNNIRSEDPSFVGLAMRPLSISLLCAVYDGVQFGGRPIWSIPGSLGKDQEQGRQNREARLAFGLTIIWQPIWSIYLQGFWATL